MRLAVLFSGGKDSTYAMFLARKCGYEVACLISVFSENKDSFMFHTPAIELTKEQARLIGVPIVIEHTRGEKEKELNDLKRVIKIAVEKYKIEGVVTGAVGSVYQTTRIQKICNELDIECFNPLWQKNQFELLNDLIENKFEVVISSVAAFSFDKSYVGKKIDKNFISKMKELNEKYKINPAGEGGEFESLVLNCPLFSRRLEANLKRVSGKGNSWRGEWE